MNAKQKKRLIIALGVFTVLALIVSLVAFALRQNISLYYTPEQVMHHEAPLGRTIRMGGMVMAHSLVKHDHSLDIDFKITDYKAQIKVHYQGLLPDLFREGQGIVVKGQLLDSGLFVAKEVLAKHDENYMPPELKDTLAPGKKTS